jgi:glycosyltransferase involved in cell wall biosynthesis
LLRSCGLPSVPLYPPPPFEGRYWSAPCEPFLLIPSRLEGHKRQALLLQALARTRSRLLAVVTGDGGARAGLEELVRELGVGERVRFLGHVPDEEQLALYARCLAVGFAPLREDYGYVTAEAMLSGKPVITCRDSGGPLELVVPGETGFVVDPDPAAIAPVLDRLVENVELAAEMGDAGRRRYRRLEIGWPAVVAGLLS